MTTENRDTLRGFALALSAYLMWGILPIYMKAVAHIPPTEVVAHRIVWSLPVAGAVLVFMRRTGDIAAALRAPRALATGAITAGLITVNWGIYVWSIANGVAVEAALGYYINPLFSVLLGAVLLGERLTRLQVAAIALAATAVVILTRDAGRVPFVALGLASSWGLYAYFKKSLPIGPNQGFLLEVILLGPAALGYMIWLGMTGKGHFLSGPASDTWLLLGCGIITAVPLLLYANGAKLLRLSTIGIMQYVTPTMIFLIAIFVFGEPLGPARMMAFPMIWAALILYSVPMLGQLRRNRAARPGS